MKICKISVETVEEPMGDENCKILGSYFPDWKVNIGNAVVFILLELASVLTLSLAPIGRVQCLLFTRLAAFNH